ncbi:MAG: UbiA family prenyltransferase [Deltaproteobacteria bacterium]|nr:UbiA family prenyltransferase [Deltaproteobacteria bacterium]
MLRNLYHVSRFHIVLIAAGGSLVFGKMLTGAFHPAFALVVAIDWFLVNIVNRVVDQTEDVANRVTGADFARQNARTILLAAIALYVAGFAVHLFWMPALIWPRLAYHLLGLVYNFPILRRRGRRFRLKEVYFFKNTASCVGFLLTLFAYPLSSLALRDGVGVAYIGLIAGFLAALEVGFEIIYDLRDLDGDRRAGIATYPVVHGETVASRIVIVLNLVSAACILVGACTRLFDLQEFVLIAAPALQLALFVRGRRRGFTQADVVAITWTFAAMNFIWVFWVIVGLPVRWPFAWSVPLAVECALVAIGLVSWRWMRSVIGDREYARTYALVAISAWAAEHSAIAVYRFYRYSPDWHAFIGYVPIAIVLIWPLVIIHAREFVRRLGLRGARGVVAGAALVGVEASLIETVCTNAGLWFWEGRGIFGVPVIGMLGWAFFALGALAALEFLSGRRVFAMPLVALISTHLLLQITWRAGLKGISWTPIPDPIVLVGAAVIATGFAIVAWRSRRHFGISLVEVFPRFLAALTMYAILLSFAAPAALVAFALLYSPPYFALLTWEWTMPPGD